MVYFVDASKATSFTHSIGTFEHSFTLLRPLAGAKVRLILLFGILNQLPIDVHLLAQFRFLAAKRMNCAHGKRIDDSYAFKNARSRRIEVEQSGASMATVPRNQRMTDDRIALAL